ncbi:MAG: hypothetical protein JO101_05240 [Candidatus Eremiobacteraeota bacterium]|nr:hypothetical protein [Candidatus Eremiobacteraeota bacterium]MBV8354701.1 hypothetical protein [Candidatus Eremiobacteraeota bacterium]
MSSRAAFLGLTVAFVAMPPAALAGTEDDALFMHIANTAGQTLVRSPERVGYTVKGVVRAFHGESPFERDLTFDPADPKPAFLAPPTFDALSHWTFDMNFNELGTGAGAVRNIDASFSNVNPLKYRTTVDVRADAVVNAVKGYRLTRVADDHIALTRIDRKKHDASLRDVYFDSATFLPERVVYDGPDDFFLDVGYALVNERLLVSSLRFGYVAYLVGHLVHSSFACEAQYGDFAFG